jgi:lipoprotein-releasing system permease protein
MRFELYVAARYLKAKRRQAVVGVVTAISIAGVTAGVAALIIALAITNGMRRDLQDKLLGSSAHVQLMQRGRARHSRLAAAAWRACARCRTSTAASPGLYEQVLVARGARDGGALIEGILPDDERTVSDLLSTATPGAVQALGAAARAVNTQNAELPPIVLGSDLAETIGAVAGDSVMVISPQGEMTPMGVIPKYVRFRLAGTFHSGFYQYDAQMGFLRLADAQRLFDEPDLLSVISFKVDNLNHAPQIAHAIEQAAGKGYMTTNWTDENRELFRALKLEQVVTFIVIALIVIVAALNILIALTMMVMEKTRDIAVMMSFGVDPGQVRRIFLLQGLLISVSALRSGCARLPRILGRRPLSLHPSVRRGLLHRHAALCAARARWRDCVALFRLESRCWRRCIRRHRRHECCRLRRCGTSKSGVADFIAYWVRLNIGGHLEQRPIFCSHISNLREFQTRHRQSYLLSANVKTLLEFLFGNVVLRMKPLLFLRKCIPEIRTINLDLGSGRVEPSSVSIDFVDVLGNLVWE